MHVSGRLERLLGSREGNVNIYIPMKISSKVGETGDGDDVDMDS
jgi:hypothetical protein